MHTKDKYCMISLRVSPEQAMAILEQSSDKGITQSDVIRNLIDHNLFGRRYNCHGCNYNFKTTESFEDLSCPRCYNDWSDYGFHETD